MHTAAQTRAYSTPNVAAIASLVWSVNPSLSPSDLKKLLVETTTDVVEHALEQLQQADAKICGSVLNNVDLKNDGYYYYGYKNGQYYQTS